MKFQKRLNEALIMRDMSASDLAKASGVNEGAISCYRNGRYKAGQESLNRLAKALRVSPQWLMGENVPIDLDVPTPPAYDAKTQRIISMVEKMTEAQKDALLHLFAPSDD